MLKDTTKLMSLFLAVVGPASAGLAAINEKFALLTAAASGGLALTTWILYVEAMRLKRIRDAGGVKLWHYPWAVVVLGVGLPVDFLLNVVVGAYWREAPKWGDKEWLLTARLDRWARAEDYPARRQFARRVCKLLNKHDEDHCFDGSK